MNGMMGYRNLHSTLVLLKDSTIKEPDTILKFTFYFSSIKVK